jgi:hypothetical protein
MYEERLNNKHTLPMAIRILSSIGVWQAAQMASPASCTNWHFVQRSSPLISRVISRVSSHEHNLQLK